MSFGFQSKSCKITSLVMQFYLFLRNVTVIIVKSFTCQLQLSIIVGKLHHANSISGRHNGQNLENRGIGNVPIYVVLNNYSFRQKIKIQFSGFFYSNTNSKISIIHIVMIS